jgi:hypothetical protein
MFFLFRCLFWLGLVFSQIAEQQGFNAAALFDRSPAMSSPGAASIKQESAASSQKAGAASIKKEGAASIKKDSAAGADNEGVGGLGRIALEAASRQCRAEPEKCLALAARALRLAPRDANPNPAASRDTLSPVDRAPLWRLRPGVASD